MERENNESHFWACLDFSLDGVFFFFIFFFDGAMKHVNSEKWQCYELLQLMLMAIFGRQCGGLFSGYVVFFPLHLEREEKLEKSFWRIFFTFLEGSG